MIKNLNLKTAVMFTATFTGILAIISSQNAIASTDADYRFLSTSDWRNCQQFGQAYQEVYAFETSSFYINICQKNNVYFYLSEAKQSEESSIFIPAHPLDNQQGFQAVNGNLSYLVLLPFQASNKKPAEAILTVKRNGQLVAVESSLNKYCQQLEMGNTIFNQSLIAFDNLAIESHNSLEMLDIPLKHNLSLSPSILKYSQPQKTEIFQINSPFDFYRIGSQLHLLSTCN